MNYIKKLVDDAAEYLGMLLDDSPIDTEEEKNEEKTIPNEYPQNQIESRDSENEVSSGIESINLDERKGSESNAVLQSSDEQYEIRVRHTHSALIGNTFQNCKVKIVSEGKYDDESSEISNSLDPSVNDESCASSAQESREDSVKFDVNKVSKSQFGNEFEDCSNVVLSTGDNAGSCSSNIAPSSISDNATSEISSRICEFSSSIAPSSISDNTSGISSMINVADKVDGSQFFNRFENCDRVRLVIGDSSKNLPESTVSSPSASSMFTSPRTQNTTINLLTAATITNSQFCNIFKKSSNVTLNMGCKEDRPESPIICDSIKPICEVKPIIEK